MHFHTLEQILAQLEKQPGWENFREYRQILQCWHNTVNQNTVKHTRPLQITRQVLWVAASSASMAQELSFQRYTLLKKLNRQLPFSLKDIRFSSSGWYQKISAQDPQEIIFKTISIQPPQKFNNNLRSISVNNDKLDNHKTKISPVEQAKLAAKSWLVTVDRSIQNATLLTCPVCSSPTPSAELERWNSCYLCVAQKWSKEYRPPTFSE